MSIPTQSSFLTSSLIKRAIFFLAILSIHHPLFAEDSNSNSNNTENNNEVVTDPNIKTIVIYGSKLNKETEYLPTDVKIIQEEDIKKSTANTISDLLATVPGINVSSLYGSGDSNTTIDLGGFGASAVNNTLILLDGQRLNDIDIAAIDLSSIPLEFIERIEILPNSGSVLYGNGASGGVINIITKTKFDKHGRISASTSTYAEPGKFQLTLANNTAQTSNLISLSSNNADGYRENNQLKQRNLLTNSQYYLDDSSQLFLSISLDKQAQELPGVRTVNPDPDSNPNTNDALNEIADDPRGTNTPNDYGTKEGFRVLSGYKYIGTNKSELNLGFGIRKKNQTAFNFSYLDTDLSTFSYTPYYKNNFQIGSIKNSYTLGLDYYSSQYDSKRSLDKNNSNSPIHMVDIEQDLAALYLQNISHLNEKLILTSGFRREKVSTDATDIYDASAPGGAFGAQGLPFDMTHKKNVYSLGLKYFITEELSSYVRQESSTRFGTVDEIFDVFGVNVLDPLKPQTGVTKEIGILYKQNTFDVAIAYYLSKYENEIHFDSALFDNINLDDTKRRGARLALNYSPIETLEINANTTYTQAEFDKGVYQRKTIPVVPRQEHQLSLNWEFSNNFLFSTSTRYVGRKYFDNDQLNSAKQIPAYTINDVKVTWLTQDLRCSLAIYNLLNEKDLFDYGVKSVFTPGVYNGYTLPDRELEASVAYTF